MRILLIDSRGLARRASYLVKWRGLRCVLRYLYLCIALNGCAPLGPKLTFPSAAIKQTENETWYDVDRDGRSDFGLHRDGQGRVASIAYDDDEDGNADRVYRLADDANGAVPHVIILLDSVPFDLMKERWDRGDFCWFDPPVKVIAPFPSLTELCYTRVLRAPALAGMTDEYYDVRSKEIHRGFRDRARGTRQPWERRLTYSANFFEASLTYLDPRAWLPIEMERMRRAVDASPDRVTFVYAVTASGMACKFGRAGIEETLDAAKQLCLQLLYERHGAIKISMMADHGHNLAPSQSAQRAMEKAISESGFTVAKKLSHDRDVLFELAALVTYVGLRTVHPAEVAASVTRAKEVELAAYLRGNSVIVRDAQGSAAIDFRDGSFRYKVIDKDVLGYQPIIATLKPRADGFITDTDWFQATVDHQYPDGPRRLWDAFHGMVKSPPDVMVTLKDGCYAGKASLERFITMKSTHGSLNQKNSATFLMTMTRRTCAATNTGGALRSSDVLEKIEPGYEPRVRN